MNKVAVPKWLILQEQIDYWMWKLKNMYEAEIRLSGIERMIDESTGFSKQKEKEAQKIMTKIKKLKVKEGKE